MDLHLQLTETERLELVGLVREAYADLNPELRRAMDHEYRERVRERRAVLAGLLQRLEPAPVASA